MRLNFNTDIIRKNKIELLDCQIDLILRSLEFYCNACEYLCPSYRNKFKTLEDNLRISLIRDTYEQILSEYNMSTKENPVLKINHLQEKKKKIA